MRPVAIIGGGISGLSAAYYLGRLGVPSRLIERRPRLGGLIRTDVLEGCTVEAGPDSWLAEKSWMLDLIRALGLGGQTVASQDSRRRTFIVRGGRPVALPASMRLLAPTKPWQVAATRLLRLPTKARMAAEWFRRPARLPERSVAEFVSEHFGDEAVEYLAQPMLAGVFGAAPESLSADWVVPQFVEYERKYGSILRGAWASRRRVQPKSLFLTLRDGMGSLVDALRLSLAPHCEILHDRARAVEADGGAWRIRLDGGDVEAETVIVATPAHEAGALLAAADPRLAERLGRISYSSSIVAGLVYPSAGFSHALDGFGLLVPRAERATLAACTWVNTKFPGRAAAGSILLRAFAAGERAERWLAAPEEEFLAVADSELRTWMGFTALPQASRAYRWKRAMPAYAVGHKDLLARIAEDMRRHRGLHLAGNGYEGLGIPDCIRRSERIARAVAAPSAPGAGSP